MNYLANLNKHELDANISLNEKTHIYNINGDTKFTSVTKWIHSHFEPFIPDKVIDNMMNSPKWPQNKYFGKTKDEIKQLWKHNGLNAAKEGTKLHYDIECYYNNEKVNKHTQNNSIEYKYFIEFAKEFAHLKPWRTEMKVYSPELRLAGSIDMIFENDDGSLMIYDWKRCKDISKSAFGNKSARTSCIEHIPDSNFWHYSIQLNTYKAILEKHYNKSVSDMVLVCLHPDKKTFEIFQVPDLNKEIYELFNLRKSQI